MIAWGWAISLAGINTKPEGYVAFATTRFVGAVSQEVAVNEALKLVAEAVASDPIFDDSPQPILAIDQIVRVRNPFKRLTVEDDLLSHPNKE